jgi:hypothetical protein
MLSSWFMLAALFSLVAIIAVAKRNRWRFSLGMLLLLVPVVAVLVAGTAEYSKAMRRARFAERKAGFMRRAIDLHERQMALIKQAIAENPKNASDYDPDICSADEALEAAKREVSTWEN